MKLIDLIKQLKRKAQTIGYTCDNCEAEVFDYPAVRLCQACRSALIKNDKYTCEKCGRPTVTEGICLNCKSVLPAFDKGISPFAYHGEVAGLINRFKDGKAYLAITLGEYMADKAKVAGEVDAVAFVPQEEKRKRARGYDQAELLAEEIANRLSLPLITPLTCLGKKEQQKELSIAERIKNVEGMYRVTDRKVVKDKRILLVDDIMTTGATGSECASRLKRAGAKAVYFLTAVSLPERK